MANPAYFSPSQPLIEALVAAGEDLSNAEEEERCQTIIRIIFSLENLLKELNDKHMKCSSFSEIINRITQNQKESLLHKKNILSELRSLSASLDQIYYWDTKLIILRRTFDRLLDVCINDISAAIELSMTMDEVARNLSDTNYHENEDLAALYRQNRKDAIAEIVSNNQRARDQREALLCAAARRGDIEMILFMQAIGATQNISTKPFEIACRMGNSDMVEVLEKTTRNIPAISGYFGGTLLHLIALADSNDYGISSYKKIIDLLIEKGIDPTKNDRLGRLPSDLARNEALKQWLKNYEGLLSTTDTCPKGIAEQQLIVAATYAANNNRCDLLRKLANNGAPLQYIQGDCDEVKEIIALVHELENTHSKDLSNLIGKLIDARLVNIIHPQSGQTILQYALHYAPNDIHRLLMAGADPTRTDLNGETALHTAALCRPKKLSFLLEYFDTLPRNNHGKTPLDIIHPRTSLAKVIALIQKSRLDQLAMKTLDTLEEKYPRLCSLIDSLKVLKKLSSEPLSEELFMVHLETIEHFRMQKILQDPTNTIFFSAVSLYDNPAILQKLIALGGKPEEISSAAHSAITNHRNKNLQFLVEKYRLELKDDSHTLLLHNAVASKNYGAIKYLIEQQCADPSLLARELLPISYLDDGCPEDIAILLMPDLTRQEVLNAALMLRPNHPSKIALKTFAQLLCGMHCWLDEMRCAIRYLTRNQKILHPDLLQTILLKATTMPHLPLGDLAALLEKAPDPLTDDGNGCLLSHTIAAKNRTMLKLLLERCPHPYSQQQQSAINNGLLQAARSLYTPKELDDRHDIFEILLRNGADHTVTFENKTIGQMILGQLTKKKRIKLANVYLPKTRERAIEKGVGYGIEMALAGLATLYTTMQPTPFANPEANFFLYGINRLVSDDPQTISPLTIDAPLRLPFMAGAALGATASLIVHSAIKNIASN